MIVIILRVIDAVHSRSKCKKPMLTRIFVSALHHKEFLHEYQNILPPDHGRPPEDLRFDRPEEKRFGDRRLFRATSSHDLPWTQPQYVYTWRSRLPRIFTCACTWHSYGPTLAWPEAVTQSSAEELRDRPAAKNHGLRSRLPDMVRDKYNYSRNIILLSELYLSPLRCISSYPTKKTGSPLAEAYHKATFYCHIKSNF